MDNIAEFISEMHLEGFTLQLVVTHGGEYFTAKLVDTDTDSKFEAPLFDRNGDHQLEGRDESMSDAVAQLDAICATRPSAC